MFVDDCTPGPWLLTEGFPFALLLLGGLVGVAVWSAPRSRVESRPAGPRPTDGDASQRQNRVYKRSGAGLLLLGALGGFGPSVFLLLRTGQVWSVNQQAPHSDADTSLTVHIAGAILWAALVAVQLWSGGVARRVSLHRVFGWMAVSALLVGVVLSGGWIWTLLHDFANGLTDPDASAGFYTIFIATCAGANGLLALRHARKKDFARHKDHALMALMWTMDPGVHRVFMWAMRSACWDCWAPECTAGQGIALAKLPANLVLVLWTLATAALAGRINRITLSNAAGQFLLWIVGSVALILNTQGGATAGAFAGIALVLGIAVLRHARARVR